MSRMRVGLLLVVLLAAGAGPAWADATVFIGANTTPTNHQVRGFSLGVGFILGVEFEYANSGEDAESDAPALRTGSASAIVQPPFGIGGVQPYATFGIGLYREQLEAHEQTGFATNLGGGLKITLFGPIRLRIDYRLFRLGDDALHSPAHRVYGGLNLRF
jgi:opacity protein-like surface antigen